MYAGPAGATGSQKVFFYSADITDVIFGTREGLGLRLYWKGWEEGGGVIGGGLAGSGKDLGKRGKFVHFFSLRVIDYYYVKSQRSKDSSLRTC